jgi:hypothetical protein
LNKHIKDWNILDFNNGSELIIQRSKSHSIKEAGLKSYARFSSNAVNIPFALAVFKNDFIDDEKKMEVASGLKSVNAFELVSSAELFYRFERDRFLFNSPAFITFTLRTASTNEAKFTGDLFKVVFFGNAGFAGATADFSATKNLSYRYHQMRLGMQKKFAFLNHDWEAGIGLSVIAARSGSSLKIDRGTLFTEQYGSFIDADYNFEYSVSDTSNSNLFTVNGVGGSADATLAYLPGSSSLRVLLFVNDFGFINWSKRSTLYSADSTLHYEGFEVNDLFNSTDTTLLPFNGDSLIHITGAHNNNIPFRTVLPVRFSLACIYSVSERWLITAAVSYCPYPDLMPLVTLQPQFSFSPSFKLATSLSYGGTDQFRTGIRLSGTFRNRIFFEAGSENVSAFFLPKETTSASLFFGSSIAF